jgi:NAD(P)-dependent dehydrogenase (short-subunit alcohol dehydrogenase family)
LNPICISGSIFKNQLRRKEMKILVTGGTNGMGKGVAKVLAGIDNQKHEIILLGRSKELGEATIRELENTTMNKKISFVLCDLTRLRDVRNAISEIQSKHKFLDCIFINAGLGYAAKRVETERCYGFTFPGKLFVPVYVDFEFIELAGKFRKWW